MGYTGNSVIRKGEGTVRGSTHLLQPFKICEQIFGQVHNGSLSKENKNTCIHHKCCFTCKERLVYVSTDSAESACRNMSSQTTLLAGDMKEKEEAR